MSDSGFGAGHPFDGSIGYLVCTLYLVGGHNDMSAPRRVKSVPFNLRTAARPVALLRWLVGGNDGD